MSVPLQTNLLRQLEAKIRGLPIQDALQRRRQTYRNTREQAQHHLAGINLTLNQVDALRTIQQRPELLADAQEKRLAAVRASARDIGRLLSDATPDNRKFSEKLDQIKRATSLLSEDAREAWNQLREEHRVRASAFRPVAKRLSQTLDKRIEELDRALSQSSAPPTDTEAVRAIVEARKAFDDEIASLEMDGPVESFLQEAQAGRGDPKALFDPQVRSYIDAHPQLWGSLRVVLA